MKEKKGDSPAVKRKSLWGDGISGVNSYPKPNPEEIIDDLNMRFGDYGPVARMANEAWDSNDLKRPSFITSLDVATGGGLAAGKVHQFDGPEGIGKNYLLYRYFANAQKLYGSNACLGMACFESFLDKQFAQQCGCSIKMSKYDIEVTQRARILRGEKPLTEKEISEAINCPSIGHFSLFTGSAEKVLESIVEAVRSNAFQIIGVDSWDAMLTASEDMANLDETPQVASASMLQTKWGKKILEAFNPSYRCPKCKSNLIEKKIVSKAERNYYYTCSASGCNWKGKKPAVEVNETTLYCIRQVRAKLKLTGGRQIGRNYGTEGARMLKHLNHIRVSMYPGPYIKNKSEEKIGKEISWEITKAKGGAREGKTGTYKFYFDPIGVDTTSDILAIAENLEIAVNKGSGRYMFPNLLGDNVLVGKEKVLNYLDDNPEFVEDLRTEIYIKSGLPHVRFR